MKNNIARFILFLTFSLLIGTCIGFTFYFIWRFSVLFIMGYYDSAPQFINFISYLFIILGLFLGFIYSKILFYNHHKMKGPNI